MRLAAPGWPDAGRRIVQQPALQALLRRTVSDLPEIRTALNAGAGEGLHSPMIRRYIRQARFLEFDLAGPRGSGLDPDGHRFTASLTNIPVRTASVDLAVCTEVLVHVADHERAVAELRRVLTPGGALLVSVPMPPGVFDRAHVRGGYTLAELAALLGRHELAITDVCYCMHALFRFVLWGWKPLRVPLALIVTIAWLDRIMRLGSPMNLVVLARVVRIPRPAAQ
jgi:SAM-dependent methyltransferase